MSDELDDGIELYPPWKEALSAFGRAGFTYGDTIPRQWFERALGMELLADNVPVLPAVYERQQFFFLQNFYPLRDAILATHQMWLDSNQRGGYLIVPPHEQAERAQEQLTKEVKSALRKGADRIRHTNVARLDDAQRREYNDRLSKVLGMAQLFQMRRRLPFDDDE